MRSEPSSGRKWSARPVSTSTRSPATGSGESSSLTNSSRTRSAVMRSSSAAMSAIASRVPGSIPKSSCAANRAARSIRSGSSANDDSGAAGVRIVRRARSPIPPNGSQNSWPGTLTAIALTVKSRRSRSSARLSP